MSSDSDFVATPVWPELIRRVRERTSARIFVDRGPAYTTRMELELRSAHANAVDAVWNEFDLQKDFSADFIAQWDLFQVSSQAGSKAEFLLRPDLGRKLGKPAREIIEQCCPKGPDLQVVIGDGLSGTALSAQVPTLMPLLLKEASNRGWAVGRCFAVRYCRVGIMNDVGDLLGPRALVLLIGERPGLATAESLSAYMAYGARGGQTDADRNLISNIHARGVRVEEAAERIANLVSRMLALQLSGTAVKELAAGLPRLWSLADNSSPHRS